MLHNFLGFFIEGFQTPHEPGKLKVSFCCYSTARPLPQISMLGSVCRLDFLCQPRCGETTLKFGGGAAGGCIEKLTLSFPGRGTPKNSEHTIFDYMSMCAYSWIFGSGLSCCDNRFSRMALPKCRRCRIVDSTELENRSLQETWSWERGLKLDFHEGLALFFVPDLPS